MKRKWNDLDAWCDAQKRGQQPQNEEVVPEHSQVKIIRVSEDTLSVNGFRYQRCGGGRRVIRKTGAGGN